MSENCIHKLLSPSFFFRLLMASLDCHSLIAFLISAVEFTTLLSAIHTHTQIAKQSLMI